MVSSNPERTCRSLERLSKMVAAESGKKIALDQVDAFRSLMARIDAALSCPVGNDETNNDNEQTGGTRAERGYQISRHD